jgi:hypothetical protein
VALTLEQLDSFFDHFLSCAAESAERAEILALKNAEGIIKQRIFNKGLATDGEAIGLKGARKSPRYEGGQYSRSYGRKRDKAGRQTGYVDLEFNGNLRRDIQVGQVQGFNALGYARQDGATLMRYSEEYRKSQIDKLTDEERERILLDYELTLKSDLQKCLNEFKQ